VALSPAAVGVARGAADGGGGVPDAAAADVAADELPAAKPAAVEDEEVGSVGAAPGSPVTSSASGAGAGSADGPVGTVEVGDSGSADGVEAEEANPISPSVAAGLTPMLHGEYADPGEEEVMVKTEFVWADGANHDVRLSGAWNGWMPGTLGLAGWGAVWEAHWVLASVGGGGWRSTGLVIGHSTAPSTPSAARSGAACARHATACVTSLTSHVPFTGFVWLVLQTPSAPSPLGTLPPHCASPRWNHLFPTVQMYHEGGGMWSVVTPVPAGTHEFKFVVDGEWRHSTRHPTVGDDEMTMNNIRVIRGPPKVNGGKKGATSPNASSSGGSPARRSKEGGKRRHRGACCTIS